MSDRTRTCDRDHQRVVTMVIRRMAVSRRRRYGRSSRGLITGGVALARRTMLVDPVIASREE